MEPRARPIPLLVFYGVCLLSSPCLRDRERERAGERALRVRSKFDFASSSHLNKLFLYFIVNPSLERGDRVGQRSKEGTVGNHRPQTLPSWSSLLGSSQHRDLLSSFLLVQLPASSQNCQARPRFSLLPLSFHSSLYQPIAWKGRLIGISGGLESLSILKTWTFWICKDVDQSCCLRKRKTRLSLTILLLGLCVLAICGGGLRLFQSGSVILPSSQGVSGGDSVQIYTGNLFRVVYITGYRWDKRNIHQENWGFKFLRQGM